MNDTSTIFDAIGGMGGCRRLSAAFYARVAQDQILSPIFPKSFHCAIESLALFLAQILGGSSDYSRKRPWLSLTEAHARFEIGEAERLAWLDNMTAALADLDLPGPIRSTLEAFFAESSGFIVKRGTPADFTNKEVNRDNAVDATIPRWSIQQTLDVIIHYIRKSDLERALPLAEIAVQYLTTDRAALANLLAEIGSTDAPDAVEFVGRVLQSDREPAQPYDLLTELFARGSILHYAASVSAVNFVDHLLALGADSNLRDTFGHTPLYAACNGAGDAGIVDALVRAGGDVNAIDDVKRCTPLHMSARRGHVDAAVVLLNHGADIEARDINGQTPLRRAVNCRKREIARLLLARGANPNSAVTAGSSAIRRRAKRS